MRISTRIDVSVYMCILVARVRRLRSHVFIIIQYMYILVGEHVHVCVRVPLEYIRDYTCAPNSSARSILSRCETHVYTYTHVQLCNKYIERLRYTEYSKSPIVSHTYRVVSYICSYVLITHAL